jgi:bifunctional polynucleotide phosphatase/kinase
MEVIILVGPPGSGKSTLAKEYAERGYKIINQDTLGSRDACLQEMERSLIRRHNIVIDRTNITKKQRSYFIGKALDYYVHNIHCISLEGPTELMVRRVINRKDHPTVTEDMTNDKKREIVEKFAKDYEKPELSEGFVTVLFKRC